MKKICFLLLIILLSISTSTYAYERSNDPAGFKRVSFEINDYFGVNLPNGQGGTYYFSMANGQEDIRTTDGEIYRVVIGADNIDGNRFIAEYDNGSEEEIAMDDKKIGYLLLPGGSGIKSLKIRVESSGSTRLRAYCFSYRVNTSKENQVFSFKKDWPRMYSEK
ncbi:hypothetical protein [Paenibacillus sp. UNC451MF]|uniref:hypothetical protein n=1 Tax=Paenibacillus sp. UNC451MF TaxID=1449063 RepID=UPI00048D5FC4|nr:hypothetical protein [Paenibacillus sp. UNC451MF]